MYKMCVLNKAVLSCPRWTSIPSWQWRCYGKWINGRKSCSSWLETIWWVFQDGLCSLLHSYRRRLFFFFVDWQCSWILDCAVKLIKHRKRSLNDLCWWENRYAVETPPVFLFISFSFSFFFYTLSAFEKQWTKVLNNLQNVLVRDRI